MLYIFYQKCWMLLGFNGSEKQIERIYHQQNLIWFISNLVYEGSNNFMDGIRSFKYSTFLCLMSVLLSLLRRRCKCIKLVFPLLYLRRYNHKPVFLHRLIFSYSTRHTLVFRRLLSSFFFALRPNYQFRIFNLPKLFL